MFKKIYRLGDKLEDKVRGKLSHFPIIYAFIGGAGVIIFWRGIWHGMDALMEYFFNSGNFLSTTSAGALPWWDGPLSMIIGAVLLLLTGLFVTSFIGNEIIISGLKGDKKIVEKTEEEVREDIIRDKRMGLEIGEISRRLENIEKILEKK